MTAAAGGIVARYDRDAPLYETHWQPVLVEASERLIERVAAPIERLVRQGRAPLLVDVGTGTGVLALAALERWPGTRVVGVDPSVGMLAVARARADRAGHAHDARLRWEVGPAEALPLPGASADVATSSFALQLVDDRAAALAEVHRVLRPGGTFVFVTWLDRGPDFEPDVEFDEAIYDCDIEEPEPAEPEPPRAGDFRSLRAATRELRAAGFVHLAVRGERLEHTWTPEAYLRFKRSYDERALFELIDEAAARRLVRRVRERWSALPASAFTFRAELVSASAERR